jgi:RimJ/RimL family protein N-acetyltransferase
MPEVTVVQLSLPALEALARGDLATANASSPVPLGTWMTTQRSTWSRRAAQVAADASAAAWVTGVVWDPVAKAAVGRAGFHGPPDTAGRAEVGYAIDPAWQRRGYGHATLRALLARARAAGVRVVRASIRPDNAASLAVIARYPFVAVGEEEDPEDGLEIQWDLTL